MSSASASQVSHRALVLGALGVVFGDIGTSPLYTMKECVAHAAHGRPMVPGDILGILSLIVWALMLVVTLKYLVFIMRADNKGEGGILALLAIVPERIRTPRGEQTIRVVAFLAVLGAALLYGDGIITPAISVLSAMEGLRVANPHLSEASVIRYTCIVLIALFAIQSRGTGSVGRLFGPVMVLWFGTLAVLGVVQIVQHPAVLAAVSPHYAVQYVEHHGFHAFLLLGAVVLAVTGGEALYADMGHFGIRAIRAGWLYVALPALLLNYFGQGALLLREPHHIETPFFAMVPTGFATYALVGLSSAATVIASQALISGAFSLTRQAMQLGFFPRVTVKHTAEDAHGQIYIPQVNWALAIGCILLVVIFRESSALAAAYGLAVTGTMAVTSILYFVVAWKTWRWNFFRAASVLVLLLALDLVFLGANLFKFFDGGYVPVLIAGGVLFAMIIWNRGRAILVQQQRNPAIEMLLPELLSRVVARAPGTAVFMASNPAHTPGILVHHVDRNRILHETVLLVTVQTLDVPYVEPADRSSVSSIGKGFHRAYLRYGFMESPNVPRDVTRALELAHVPFDPKDATYYLGRERILATGAGRMGRVTESFFAFLQRNSVPADTFFRIPPAQVMEVGVQVDL